jgi:hypothetical protein
MLFTGKVSNVEDLLHFCSLELEHCMRSIMMESFHGPVIFNKLVSHSPFQPNNYILRAGPILVYNQFYVPLASFPGISDLLQYIRDIYLLL